MVQKIKYQYRDTGTLQRLSVCAQTVPLIGA
jgi:hypothetical protein